MPSARVGDILRNRREQLGISVQRAASVTNIRARVIETIEASDFANYPPYGHALGMLSSYARFLELDPQIVLRTFESDYSSYKARANAGELPSGRADRQLPERVSEQGATGTVSQRRRAHMSGRRREANAEVADVASHEQGAENDGRYTTGSVRVVAKRQTGKFSRLGERSADASVRSSSARPERSSGRSDVAHTGRRRPSAARTESSRKNDSKSPLVPGYDNSELSFFTDEPADEGQTGSFKRRRSRRKPIEPSSPRSDEGSIVQRVLTRATAIFSERRTRIIAIMIVVFVIIVAVIANLLISTAGSNDTDIIPVEGGAADTTKTSTDSKEATATVTTTNGTPITVKIAVAEDSTSLINVIYDDDHAYNGTAVGPWSQEFLVTESLSASFGNPDAVAVTQNGNAVPIEKAEDGTGKLTIAIKSSATDDAQ